MLVFSLDLDFLNANSIQPMSKRKTYFYVTILCAAVVIGGLSLWHSGLWMEGRNKVPNITFLSMVLLVFSQAIALKTIFAEEIKRNH